MSAAQPPQPAATSNPTTVAGKPAQRDLRADCGPVVADVHPAVQAAARAYLEAWSERHGYPKPTGGITVQKLAEDPSHRAAVAAVLRWAAQFTNCLDDSEWLTCEADELDPPALADAPKESR